MDFSRREIMRAAVAMTAVVATSGCAYQPPQSNQGPGPEPFPWPPDERTPLPYRFDFSVMS